MATRPLPDRFYKFRSLAAEGYEQCRQVLRQRSLHWPCPAVFNDPYDCAPLFRVSADREAFRAYLKSVVRERGEGLPRAERQTMVTQGAKVSRKVYEQALIDGHAERLAGIGVCSLSEVKDEVLMWSHYADSHRGFALVFAPAPGDGYFEHAQSVSYTRDRPVIALPYRDPEAILAPALLTKADFWAYEREWRLLSPDRPPGYYRFPAAALTGLIFGARMPPEHREAVVAWLSETGPAPELFEAHFHASQFRIEVRAVA